MSDCISREAAIKSECESCDRLNCGYKNSGKDYASCDIVDRLKILPSVTPTVKTGHWKKKFMQLRDQAVYQYVLVVVLFFCTILNAV